MHISLDTQERTRLLLGTEAVTLLKSMHVAVFGIGGVGGAACEALARCEIGSLTMVDKDVFEASNINRQLFATPETVGRDKVDAAAERILEIHPECSLHLHKLFYLPETAAQIDLYDFDYILDCIDTVTGKLALIERATQANIPIISAMGAGNKLDPSAFRVADIYETSVCPLAKVMRKECKNRGIEKLKVVYSKEEPKSFSKKQHTPGSISFVPPVMGYIMAGECIKDLVLQNPQ